MKKSLLFIAGLLVAGLVSAETSTLYYMNYLPYRNFMNPALRPVCDTYVELPVISTLSVELGNNSVSANDVLLKSPIGMVTALHPLYGNRDAFYKALKSNTKVRQEFMTTILGFGFSVRKHGYFSFNCSLREDLSVGLSKDLVGLGLYGTPDTVGVNYYNFRNTGAELQTFMDFSGAYTHQINQKWSVGARLHILWGLAQSSATFKSLRLAASQDMWHVEGEGAMRINIPGSQLKVDENGKTDITTPSSVVDVLKDLRPNIGVAADLGAEYKPLNCLRVSFALKDLGFIYWQKGQKAGGNLNFDFDGIRYRIYENTNHGDSIANAFKKAYAYQIEDKAYARLMHAKLYAGIEYAFLRDMMSLGLLSRTDYSLRMLTEELTLSYNLRPTHWFGLSASYSFISGGWSTLGLGFNLRLPPFSIYVAGDYIPLYYSAEGLPYKNERFNVQAGIVLTFGCKKCSSEALFTPTDFSR